MNKVMKFFVVSILAVVVIFVCFTLAIAGNDVLLCHKPDKPAEHWLWVDDNAVAAHLAHGDWLWSKDATVCGGVEITPPPVPVVTCGNPCDPSVTEIPAVTETPEPTPNPITVKVWKLWLPVIEMGCDLHYYWPGCSKLRTLSDPYPPPN